MRKIKTRDIVLILIIIILAAALLIAGLQSRKHSDTTATEPAQTEDQQPVKGTEETVEPAAESQDTDDKEESVDESAVSDAAEQAKEYIEKYPAESYLIVTTSSGVHTPIPLNEEGSFKISFTNGEYNIVHIGKNSFYMESSTCDNQNCVGEGEVTLENRDSRALYDMVLCLPHNVSLQLVDPDEALSMLTEMYEYAATQESPTVSAAPEGEAENAG